MNTPAHVVLNMLCLGRQDTPGVIAAVIFGAILPDAPIFAFYFIERLIKGTPEGTIWREAYYLQGWQNFIDVFNSIPLIIVGLIATAWFGSKIGLAMFSSMFLHVLGDLPLHHHDAHRHFFPLSNWRFQSPISYWDPAFHGDVITRLEILMVIISCGVLFLTYQSVPAKVSVGLVGLSYVLFFIYVFTVWT
ncbi:MAG: hypothetical protein F6J95_003145 [Leptolyngbya sp. SIO1E4]|nr:hypothetical protein [Leptolyngbya sp. SIO1E4]